MNPKNADQDSDGARTGGGEPAQPFQSLGQQLRSAREARGVSLREVSEQTRISVRYLEAIESDDYKHLPGGIFNRSFVKAYARQVGFNEAAAMEAFTRTASEQGDKPDEFKPYRPRVYVNNDSRPSWLTALLTLLILAILSLGVYAALHWYQRRNDASAPGEAQAPATNGDAARQASNPNAPPSPAATDSLSVRVRAMNQNVWIQTQVDDARAEEATLNPNEIKDFAPRERLRLRYAKNLAGSLEVMINGRAARVPAESRATTAEMIITKDYEQLLQ